jgi:hypothetical protein
MSHRICLSIGDLYTFLDWNVPIVPESRRDDLSNPPRIDSERAERPNSAGLPDIGQQSTLVLVDDQSQSE